MLVYGDAWEWVWDRFSSVTMHSNGTYQTLDAATDAAARCVHTLKSMSKRQVSIEIATLTTSVDVSLLKNN